MRRYEVTHGILGVKSTNTITGSGSCPYLFLSRPSAEEQSVSRLLLDEWKVGKRMYCKNGSKKFADCESSTRAGFQKWYDTEEWKGSLTIIPPRSFT